jgi:DNA-binding NarL/FixJ family response regulator
LLAITRLPSRQRRALSVCAFGQNLEQVMVRVLLADSRFLIRAGLRALLQSHGGFHVCGEARNGQEAVSLACQKKPDVVVIDINISLVNGIEASRQIRRASSSTEILIFTREDNGDLIREAICAGARGYLLKSATDDEIVEAIDALSRHRSCYSAAISELLLSNLSTDADESGVHLTSREQEILRLIAEGRRSKNIGLMLGISPKTVQAHRSAAMRKLQLESVADVVRYAVREKLVHT